MTVTLHLQPLSGRTCPGQRIKISLISTRSPQPIHWMTAGRAVAGAGLQLESRAGLTTLVNFYHSLEETTQL